VRWSFDGIVEQARSFETLQFLAKLDAFLPACVSANKIEQSKVSNGLIPTISCKRFFSFLITST